MAEERRSTVKFPVVTEVAVSERPPKEEGSSPAISSIPSPRQPSYIDPEWLDAETNVTRPTETSIELPPAVSKRDRALLTVLSGLNAWQVFTVDTAETRIGRGRDVQVRIEDVGISRVHSRLVRTMDGKYVLEDLKSTNGTFLGGKRIDRAEVHTGDRLQIGPNVVLRFAVIDEAEEQLAYQLY